MTSAATVSTSAEERRSELLRAAYLVMARDGVHRTPLARVAEEAGVSKGLLLYHFQSKDALVLKTLEWVLDTTASRIRQALAESSERSAAISVVVDAVWVGPDQNRDFFRFYLDGLEHQTRSPQFEELGDLARTIINGLYREVIESSTTLSGADSEAATTTMRAIIEGFFLQWLQTHNWKTNHQRYRDRCLLAVSSMLALSAGRISDR